MNASLEWPIVMSSESMDVPQGLHRGESGDTCGNAKQGLYLRPARSEDESQSL